ncbi:MAG: phospholipase D family protein [Nanoarchaeota archaeon]|nr:phospholipase D family protein [Nanoarchaeota archaeon]
MITSSNKDQIYIGRQAGKEIHEKIKNAKKSVKIVSPYLSPDYIKDLLVLHKKNVEITLVTCDKIENNSYSDFKTSDLVKKEKIHDKKSGKMKKMLVKSFIWFLAVSVLLVILAFVFSILFIFAGIFFFLSMASLFSSFYILEYTFKYKPLFKIKVFDSTTGKNPRSTELVHSKIFVIDEEIAFLGSINFTYSGFKTHYETTIKVEDKNAVKDISHEVEMLYLSKDLKEKPVEDWLGSGG